MEHNIQPSTRVGAATISLACMFQILTACCIFFALLKVSPILAIVTTAVATPAIIRTGRASDLHRQTGKAFSWSTRIYCFIESVGIEFVTLILALLAFAIVSLFFGAVAVMFALMYQGNESLSDVAVVGTAGGMIWGFAGAILAVGMTAKLWNIKSHLA